jgi:hypothetical protein
MTTDGGPVAATIVRCPDCMHRNQVPAAALRSWLEQALAAPAQRA